MQSDELHVLSVGVDLVPALDAQGFAGDGIVEAVAEACRRGGGEGVIPKEAGAAIRAASQVLNIAWIADALELHRRASSARAAADVREGRNAARDGCRTDRRVA
jgi:hypothetical protein